MGFFENSLAVVWRRLYLQTVRRRAILLAIEVGFVIVSFAVILKYDHVDPSTVKKLDKRQDVALAPDDPFFGDDGSAITAREWQVVYGPETNYTRKIVDGIVKAQGHPRQHITDNGNEFPRPSNGSDVGRSRRIYRRLVVGEGTRAPPPDAVEDAHDVPESCLQAIVDRHWSGLGGYSTGRLPAYDIACVQFWNSEQERVNGSLSYSLVYYMPPEELPPETSPLDVASYLAGYTAEGPVVNDTRRRFIDLILAAQTTIDEVHMNIQGETRRAAREPAVMVTYRSMPMKPPFLDVPRYRNGFFFALSLAFCLPLVWRISEITNEMESGLKEHQRLMGLTSAQFWTGHFLSAFMVALLEGICTMLVIYFSVEDFPPPAGLNPKQPRYAWIAFQAEDNDDPEQNDQDKPARYKAVSLDFLDVPYVQHADVMLLLVNLLIFHVSHTTLAVLVACVVPVGRWAMLLGFGVYFILPICDADNFSFLSDVPLSDYLVEDRFSKLRKCIYPNYAMATVMKIICIFADFELDAGWSVVDQFALGCDSVTIIEVWAVMGLVILAAAVLIWYLSHVLPWTNASPEKIYFPLLPSYWCPHPYNMCSVTKGEPLNADRFEALPTTPAVVECKNLVKNFGGLAALDGVNLSVHKHLVTVLLGHNGAGKTTLMSILTGLVQPSGGSATVAGWDINTEAARREVGFCPQKDIFFDDLTVEEHLEYFAVLRGVDDPSKRVETLLKTLRLTDKASQYPAELSGGQRRKLSVAVALVSSPQLLILDEPTSAMDPETRRYFWKLIGRFRGQRTVLISTHDMEEADALGDRIVIMHSGKVICSGSTNFLKIACGVGYKLNVGKARQGFHIDSLMQLVRQTAPLAAVEDERIGDVTIALHTFNCAGFENMFRQLEHGARRLGITGVGVTVSTMTDAYLKISNDYAAEQKRLRKEKEKKGASKPQTPTSPKGDANVPASPSRPTSPADVPTPGVPPVRGVPPVPAAPPALAVPPVVELPPVVAVQPAVLAVAPIPASGAACLGTVAKLPVPAAAAGIAGKPIVQSPLKPGGNQGAAAKKPDPEPPAAIPGSPPKVAKKTGPKFTLSPDDFQKFHALLSKRWCYLGRTRFLFFTGWLLPIAIAYVATTTLTAQRVEDVGEQQPRNIVLTATAQFGDDVRAFLSEPKETNASSDYRLLMYNQGVAIDALEDPMEELLGALEDNYLEYATAYPFGAIINSSTLTEAWYNPTSMMSLPVLNNLMHTIQLRTTSGRRDQRISTELKLYALPNEVLRTTAARRRHEEALGQLQLAVQQAWIYWGCMATVSMGLIISSFVVFPAAENHSGARGLQLMTGVSGCTFMSAHFLFDLAFYLVPMAVIYGVFAFIQHLRFETIVALAAIVLSFAPSGIMLPYLVTEHIESEGTAYSIVVGLFAVGGPAVFLFYMTSLPALNSQVLRVPLLFLPPFLLGATTIQAVSLDYEANMCELLRLRPKLDDLIIGVCDDMRLLGSGIVHCCKMLAARQDAKEEPWSMIGPFSWSWYSIVGELLLMLLLGAVLFYIASRGVSGEFGYENKLQDLHTPALDDDVDAEKKLVNTVCREKRFAEYAMVARNLHKFFDKFYAVRGIYLALNPGECFGLVGVNGAGKTTTFQMLAALIEMTDGNAYTKTLVLSKAPRQWQARIGYCPQSDALLGKLNAFETLFMFGRLRGVPERPLSVMVSQLIAMVDLSEHASKPCEYYSGGNKRKLSIAVAVVGFPPIVLLDEPFAGVDVVSRNHIRQALVKLKNSTKTAFILTTHNMEECEVSCDRIGIMVKGQMTCLGPLQHLRQKFGGGLTLKFRLPDGSPVDTEQLDKAVLEAFPGAKRLDTQDRLQKVAEYRLKERPAWSTLFHKIAALRRAFTFEHVIAADANLEQLLVTFARKARAEAKLEPKDEN
ncbi:phospholipid-transporting ATPase ABCA3 [Rhipicephalus sanguineus]|uniref:phospholipid-transporting ATPase ABCA3 n=1 Tax=Rhipicephalus sanguineus TaxID=34632 RepID=UPI0020C48E34|nr:phospholipid-transporting ATPase ABCA3 [Rhipicephalus sanguineus]